MFGIQIMLAIWQEELAASSLPRVWGGKKKYAIPPAAPSPAKN